MMIASALGLEPVAMGGLLARLPHTAMLHHRLARPRVRSAKIRVQLWPSHARMEAKSSSHTHRARASPIGCSKNSGDRQRRIV